MKVISALILAVMLMGCGVSEEVQRHENRMWFELTHNMNIVRVRHFDEETKVLTVTFSYHAPAYFWFETKDSSLAFVWKVIDIRDNVLFLPTYMTDFKTFNRLENPMDWKVVMEEAIMYYEQRREQ